mmetsp:Transcript_10185/g.22023  ORF Transcript_10185/g.22023 Transcript_10185/m.22023 type:complete len:264 (+) Transcript_10185:1397-2188(+)
MHSLLLSSLLASLLSLFRLLSLSLPLSLPPMSDVLSRPCSCFCRIPVLSLVRVPDSDSAVVVAASAAAVNDCRRRRCRRDRVDLGRLDLGRLPPNSVLTMSSRSFSAYSANRAALGRSTSATARMRMVGGGFDGGVIGGGGELADGRTDVRGRGRRDSSTVASSDAAAAADMFVEAAAPVLLGMILKLLTAYAVQQAKGKGSAFIVQLCLKSPRQSEREQCRVFYGGREIDRAVSQLENSTPLSTRLWKYLGGGDRPCYSEDR